VQLGTPLRRSTRQELMSARLDAPAGSWGYRDIIQLVTTVSFVI